MGAERGVFTLGHSPDPDDAFMFYAMAENKIDLRGYRFEHRLEDIQTLNERALRGELHISAISIHAYAYVSDKYALLPCGASMGDGYGPILVRKIPKANAQIPNPNQYVDLRESLRGCVIAVPGRITPPTYLRKLVSLSSSAACQRSIASDKARRTRASLNGGCSALKTRPK